MRPALVALALSMPVYSADLEFKERFADPATRTEALGRLVPETRDWFFYRALDHQLAGRAKECEAVLAEWRVAIARKERPVDGDGLRELENRTLLLAWQGNPDKTADDLIRHLELKFDDTRPDAAADEKLPTALAADAISVAAFEQEAAAQRRDNPWEGYGAARLYAELDKAESFSVAKRRWVLGHLKRADHPAVPKLIAAELAEGAKRSANGLPNPIPLLDLLTVAQMDELVRLEPRLKGQASFVLRYLGALRPADPVALRTDRAVQAAYAKRCLEFTRTLSPALAGLHLAALESHLSLQRELGNYPQDDFLTLLAVPRKAHPLLRAVPEKGLSVDESFWNATGLPEVPDDMRLLQDYLDHFLGAADSPAAFAPFIEDKRLALLHAEARLLAGADPAKWGAALDPVAFRELRERTTLGFAPGQPERLAADARVKLALDLKNTPELLVRVYPLDLDSWFSTHDKEPEADLDLDGLVPAQETRLTYTQPALVRHRESIDLPELKGRGAWIVETVSRGVAARALIRKGSLATVAEPVEGGVAVRVFDETGTPVPDAVLTVDGQMLKPGADGRIAVMAGFHADSPRAVASGGGLATAVKLSLRPSAPYLDARFHVDREQLIANQRATLRMALRLTDLGAEVPLERLKNLTLTLTATLGDGVTTQRVISDGLKPLAEQTVDFLVPPDARKVGLKLTAKVDPKSGGEPVEQSASREFAINGVLDTDTTGIAQLSLTTRGYRLDLRGRNGEALANRAVEIEWTHRDYADPVTTELRTGADGRIELGELKGIASLKVSGNDIQATTMSPEKDTREGSLPRARFELGVRDVLRLPVAGGAERMDRARFRLLRTAKDGVAEDLTDGLAVEDGRLVVKGLAPGEYALQVDDEDRTLKVHGGVERDGLIFTPEQVVQKSVPVLPAVAETTTAGDTLTLRLSGATANTRVTLVGTRYLQSGWRWSDLAAFDPRTSITWSRGESACGYLTERKLDDEMRYILDRRNAVTFPGTLLPRPGLLVNRWTEQETTANEETAARGDDGRLGSSGLGAGAGASTPFGMEGPGKAGGGFPCFDFLASGSVVRYTLTPDAQGVVRVPLADFRTSQSIAVVVTDQGALSRTTVPLAPSEPPLRDLRLARPLDPAKHHTGTRGASFLGTGGETTIDNMLDADWRAFTTLEEAWSYLAGATPAAKHGLQDFAFLHHWSELSETDKLAKLSEHACHELHLFLARKDRAFFDKYVKPGLAGKMEPTFLDDYLLERDLTAYLRPYAWKKLNAAEKALLARAVPAARDRVVTELRQRWELEAPDADTENRLFLATLRGEGLSEKDSLGLARNEVPMAPTVASGAALTGSAYEINKLQAIVIPSIYFEDTTVEQALEFLRVRSAELDPTELDPAKKGVNFIVRRPAGGGGSGISGAEEPGNLRIKQLRLRNVPLAVALKYICDATRLRYKVDEYAVTLVPQTETGEDLFTRAFVVPRDFSGMLDSGGSDVGNAAADPFASAAGSSGSEARMTTRPPISELLKRAGIALPEGASATLEGNRLLVTSSPTELDKVAQLTDTFKDAKVASADPFAASDGPTSGVLPLPVPSVDPDTTRVWRESNYHEHRGSSDEEFIPLNRFWIDLAAWDGKGPFLSPHFNECIHHANEALMCLALLDLPERAEKPEVRAEAAKLHVKARAPMLLFYKDTRETDKVAADAPVLVRETLHRLGDDFRTVNGRKQQATVGDKLVAGEHYGISLVVTNPGGDERRVDVLAQIPAGAMPLKGLPVTLSKTVTLKPYGVANLDLAFYFPAAGSFTLYPLHVTEGETVLAHAGKRTLEVAAEAAEADTTSWPVLARDGTAEQVLERLRRDNLHTLDLHQILWRLQDKGFFTAATAVLRERLVFSPEIAAYGFKHRDVTAIREYLENSHTLTEVGGWLSSPLLDVRPQEHLEFESLEFDPLVNRRAHRHGDNPRLSNVEAAKFQETVLDQLAWKPALDDGDQLRLALLLQLQDRTGEAIERFNQIDPAKLPGRTAYDYLHAVLLFAMQKPEDARTIATRYAGHPLALWRGRFAAVVAQADEIAALAKGRPAAPPATATEPSLEIASAADGTLQLKHRGLQQARLQLFHVDLEVLFSKDPFLKGGMDGLPPIRANDTREVTLAANGETRVELPESFRHGNVLVAADAGTKQVLQVLDSRAIDLLRNPAERTVQVLDTAGKPLVKSYVKVYVETRGGQTRFLKDGYTDLRGKFDYLTHSFDPDLRIKRVALLVVHPDAGAKTLVFEP
ncbi:hypothetical protein [Luteolibacter sp. LG18]|uniref:MSCRAMM family protein n=1 Tax=Luteolibacter sp. LG18 TaxID=2819286 RepID=UPI002B29F89D|nr:hypothetical protein llg_25160 [Luteolibacter sp. LG18]